MATLHPEPHPVPSDAARARRFAAADIPGDIGLPDLGLSLERLLDLLTDAPAMREAR